MGTNSNDIKIEPPLNIIDAITFLIAFALLAFKVKILFQIK